MLLTTRISQRRLAGLCRRLATSLEAGVDMRRTFSREASDKFSGRFTMRMQSVAAAINRGETLHDALAETGQYFPSLFHELVDVGEESGQLPEVFRHLAEHYERQVKLRRILLASITWPVVQLTAAVVIIGFMIWIMGVIAPQPIDILGIGLVGTSGALTWFLMVGCIVAFCGFVYLEIRREAAWVRPLERTIMRIPVLGSNLRTLAMARLTWCLQLTMETGMELQKAIPLSLRSTRIATFTQPTREIVNAISAGSEISEAFAETGVYPLDFLEVVEVGERSGRLPESLAILSRQYQERAQQALAALNVLAGFAVWAIVAILITIVIFKLFFVFYLDPLNQALEAI